MAADPVRSTETINFALEHAAGWSIYLYLGLLVLLGWWAWTRYGPAPAGASGVLARCCRILTILTVLCLLTGPAWRRTRTTTIPGKLVVAIDTSLSMARSDGPDGRSRLSVAADFVKRLQDWQRQHDVEIVYYHIGQGVEMVEAKDVAALEALGSASALGRDLEEILANNSGADALALITDGRVNEGSSLDALATQLHDRNLPTFLLPVGSEQIDPELRLEQVDGPGEIPLDERQPYHLRLVHRNLGPEPLVVTVTCDGEELDRQEMPIQPGEDPADQVQLSATLNVTRSKAGDAELVFTVRQGSREGNPIHRKVSVSQRALQVLVLAWGPRWEFRYLREALKRDPTVTVHTYLAEGLWRRWGQEGPKELPITPTALRDYDVIILGDVPVTAPSLKEHLGAIEQAVRQNGSGLIWLPGEYGHTASFRNTDLGKLLPVDLPDKNTIMEGYISNHEVSLLRTDEAKRYNLLESGEQPWESLPKLRGACPLQKADVRQNARCLMRDQDDNPIIVHANYGAGAALFIAVDDTWRWRRQVGDIYLHRYWSQLLRHVAIGRGLGGRAWRLQCLPYQTDPGTPVVLAVVPAKPVANLSELPDQVTVRLSGVKGKDHVVLLQRAPQDKTFRNTIPAPGVDTWTIDCIAGLSPEDVQPGELVVLPPQREIRDPRLDMGAITRLAEATNGTVRQRPEDLVAELPELSQKKATSNLEPLWDRWWFLLLLVGALGVEWAIRRSHRLP